MAHQMVNKRCNGLLNYLEQIIENHLFFTDLSDHIPALVDDNLSRIYVFELFLDASANASQDDFKIWAMFDLESGVIASLWHIYWTTSKIASIR